MAPSAVLVDGTAVATATYDEDGIWRVRPNGAAMARLGLEWVLFEPYGEDEAKRAVVVMGVTVDHAPGYSEFLGIRGAFSSVAVDGDSGTVTV